MDYSKRMGIEFKTYRSCTKKFYKENKELLIEARKIIHKFCKKNKVTVKYENTYNSNSVTFDLTFDSNGNKLILDIKKKELYFELALGNGFYGNKKLIKKIEV